MNKINIRCCLKIIEKSFNIHFRDYAIIIMFRYISLLFRYVNFKT